MNSKLAVNLQPSLNKINQHSSITDYHPSAKSKYLKNKLPRQQLNVHRCKLRIQWLHNNVTVVLIQTQTPLLVCLSCIVANIAFAGLTNEQQQLWSNK